MLYYYQYKESVIIKKIKSCCTLRYTNYNVISIDFESIKKNEQDFTFAVIKLEPKKYLDKCPKCNSKCHIQSKKYRVINDIGINKYFVKLLVPNIYYECKKCSFIFNENDDKFPKSKTFSTRIRDYIKDNSELSCRELTHKLLIAEKVLISFDQVNQIQKELKKEEYIFEVDKNTEETKKQVLQKDIHIVKSANTNPEDFIFETVLDFVDLFDIFSKHFITKNIKKSKYSNLMYLVSTISAKLRNNVSCQSFPLAITSTKIINKLGFNIINIKDYLDFETSTFLRNLYKYDSKELTNIFNNIYRDITNKININTNEYIIDSTKITVNPNINYEQMGVINGDEVEYGYKATAIYKVNKNEYSNVLIPYKCNIDSIQVNDSAIFNEIIKDENLPAYSTIICDRGYTSKEAISTLLDKNIYVTIPLKKSSDVLREALSHAGVRVNDISTKDQKSFNEIFKEKIKNTSKKINNNIKWIANPVKYYNDTDQEITLIKDVSLVIAKDKVINVNVALIRYKKENECSIDEFFKKYEDKRIYYYDDKYSYAGIMTTNNKMSAREIIKQYSKRMLIESQFKQMKQEWRLGRLLSKRYSYITYHILTVFLAMMIFQIFKITDVGRIYENQTKNNVTNDIRINKSDESRIFIVGKNTFDEMKLKEFLEYYDTLDLDTKVYVKSKSE